MEIKKDLVIQKVKIIPNGRYRVLYICEPPGIVVEGKCIYTREDIFILRDDDYKEHIFNARYVNMIAVDLDEK